MSKNYTYKDVNLKYSAIANDHSNIHYYDNPSSAAQGNPKITSPPITSHPGTSKEPAAIPASDVVEFMIKDEFISIKKSCLIKNAPQFWDKYVYPGLNGASQVTLEGIEPKEFQHLARFIESEELDKEIKGDSTILSALLLAADKVKAVKEYKTVYQF